MFSPLHNRLFDTADQATKLIAPRLLGSMVELHRPASGSQIETCELNVASVASSGPHARWVSGVSCRSKRETSQRFSTSKTRTCKRYSLSSPEEYAPARSMPLGEN